MTIGMPRPRGARLLRLFAAALSVLCVPTARLEAAINTVFSCPAGGNHDSVSNGFFVTGIGASNVHTVTIFYSTDTDGTYQLSITAHRSDYTGPQVGTTQTQMVTLSSSGDTAVTWSFNDAPITSGDTLAFTHTWTGPGGVTFDLTPQSDCPTDVETVGLTSTPNELAVGVTITTNTSVSGGGGCVANPQTLCIDNQPGDKRFAVTVSFATSQGGGRSGNGEAIALGSLGVSEGGLFWFFGPTNPEMLIKLINGCSLNNRFWVFYSATTNVGFTVTVTDTKTGHKATYKNNDLTAAPPVQDTNALACP